MTDGVKRSRRAVIAVATGVGVLAVLGAHGLLLTRERDPLPPATWTQSSTPAVPVSKPPFTVKPVAGRLGEVVDTGLPGGPGTDWVLSFVPATWSETPDITIALSIGERGADGKIVEALTISDDRLTDHATGFHPMQAPMLLEHGLIQPAFGYYIGRPAKITAVFDGVTTVAAHLAAWSEDPDVTIFWFAPGEGAVEEVSDLCAFDASGARMPDGTIRVSYF
jgi:hypothetical protein